MRESKLISTYILIVATLCWLLAGCATTGDFKADIKAEKVKLDEFTIKDLDQAIAMANEPPIDMAAASCYPALKARLLKQLNNQSLKPVGLISLFEVARKGVRPQGPVDDKLDIACATLRDQTITDIIKLDAKLAALVASGGITGITDLPKALAAVKKLLGLMSAAGVHMP